MKQKKNAVQNTKQAQIVVLGTGGTIAGLAESESDNLGYIAGQVDVEQLLQSVPDLEQCCLDKTLVHEQVCNIDSKNMDFAQWRLLAQRCAHWLAQDTVAGIVITHGTDTIEETAFFLRSVLQSNKPVVLTCSMRPASSAQADGPSNLADALLVASQKGTQGVMVVCAGHVLAAGDVQKTHSYWLNAFSAGDAGALAYVEHGRIRQLRSWPQTNCIVPAQYLPLVQHWPRVDIFWSCVGASAEMIPSLCAQGIQGLVVASTGGGTINDALVLPLQTAQAQGIAVVRASRCAFGKVWEKPDDIFPASSYNPLKARIELLLKCLKDSSADTTAT